MSTPRLVLLVPSLLILGLLAPAGAATAAGPAPSSTRVAALTTAQFEARLLALSNARRAKVGCAPWKKHAALTRAARLHTARMVRTGSFSHQVPGEAGLGRRATAAGYTRWKALGENIAWGKRATPASVFGMWMRSAPHKANIQNCRFRHAGFGVRYARGTTWVTGDFGRR